VVRAIGGRAGRSGGFLALKLAYKVEDASVIISSRGCYRERGRLCSRGSWHDVSPGVMNTYLGSLGVSGPAALRYF